MISKKFCPRCRSEDVAMIAGGVTGTWMCKKCGFSGSVFPEREIVGREMKSTTFKKSYRSQKQSPKEKGKSEDLEYKK
ncbi:MAG: TFIIB-type zinc ribbon-containing protein [Nanoarchaeota archaeon]|nr:TFIIB-type zinc ribbon-containing protein [Nanoarchaeota archaeon]